MHFWFNYLGHHLHTVKWYNGQEGSAWFFISAPTAIHLVWKPHQNGKLVYIFAVRQKEWLTTTAEMHSYF